MRKAFLMLLLFGVLHAKEFTLEEVLKLALENSLELKSAEKEVEATNLELKAAKGAYLPRFKAEETFTRTDIPAYAFMSKLNQGRIGFQDFEPSRLNKPTSVSNFETKLSLDVPIWLGGKIQAMKRASEHNLFATKWDYEKKQEDVLLRAYHAYLDAVLAKESIDVAKQAVADAKEHVKLAESMHEVGIALLSDVLRAKVYLSKAEEMLSSSENSYKVAKRAIELVSNTKLGDFEVINIDTCPTVDIQGIRSKALENRKDIKALSERIKAMEEAYRITLSDNLPQLYAFGSYSLYSKSSPFGSDGKGYMVGFGASWAFDTGLSTLRRAQANLERKKSLEDKLNLLKDSVLFDIDKAYAEYQNSLLSLRSAEERVKESEEVVRVIELRYKAGIARMIDLLDAQTELDRARFDRIKALNACQKSYSNLLYYGGVLREVER